MFQKETTFQPKSGFCRKISKDNDDNDMAAERKKERYDNAPKIKYRLNAQKKEY